MKRPALIEKLDEARFSYFKSYGVQPTAVMICSTDIEDLRMWRSWVGHDCPPDSHLPLFYMGMLVVEAPADLTGWAIVGSIAFEGSDGGGKGISVSGIKIPH